MSLAQEALGDKADIEEGELDDITLSQEKASDSQKPKVPDPPPSPQRTSSQSIGTTNRKKLKKLVEKAVTSGKKVDKNAFRAIYGAEAKAKVVLSQQLKAIRPHDVQALVLWVLADRTEGKNPTWAFIQNVPLIKQVVLLFVPAISASLYSSRQDLMPNLAKIGPAVPVLAKDGLTRPAYTLAMLLKVPFSKEKQKYLSQTAAELEKPKVAGQSKDMPFPPSYYILKPDMMDKLGYPLPEKKNGTIQLPEGFVSTIKRNPEELHWKELSFDTGNGVDESASIHDDSMYALDCEMCETLPGLYELTRISLLNAKGETVYDQLVRPHNLITNYHTDKSGITEALLEDVDTTLQDVQGRFLELVPAEAILVGHALENDLKALKVVHMRCIDTGALFPHPKGLPFRSALRLLAQNFLKRQIQQGEHDSVIDAKTALDLAVLKMRNGPAFGLTSARDFGEPLPEVLMRANKSCTLVDKADTLHKYLTGCADGIACSSDKEVTEKIGKEVQKDVPAKNTAKFVFGQLRGVADFYEAQVGLQRKQAASERARSELQASALQPTRTASGPEHDTLGTPREATGSPGSEGVILKKRPHWPGPGSQLNVLKTEITDGSNTSAGKKRNRDDLDLDPDPADKRQRTSGAADISIQASSPGSHSTDVRGSNDANLKNGFALLEEEETEDGSSEKEDGEQEDSAEEAIIRQTDANVGRVFSSLPPDSMLVVCTGHGNTARTRYAQEMKLRRAQGLEKPPWTQSDEKDYLQNYVNVSSQGVCFVAVK